MLASPAHFFASLPPARQQEMLEAIDPDTRAALAYHWDWWARPNQLLPKGHWNHWLILAGRGFGKTRTGAETVRRWIKTTDMVNLIGATADDIRDIMVEGESGILAVCPDEERPRYVKSERKLEWPNGAVSLLFSAQEPDRLRGKQHKKLWADEMAAWAYEESWDQAKFGLRLGAHPQSIITTTPKPIKNIRDLLKEQNVIVTKGTSYENRENLATTFFDEIVKRYEGTRLGRQELNAEMLEDTPGALWTRDMIRHIQPISVPQLQRIVIGVDPAISSEDNSNETGIVAVGVDSNQKGYVLADVSGILKPHEWGKRAIALFKELSADTIVCEVNQGGEMVTNTIKSIDPVIPVKAVHASRGKYIRAEPISAIYSRDSFVHVGMFEQLEDSMCTFTPDFDRAKQGSPDRLDAMVWAATELFPSLVAELKLPKRREIVVR